MSTRLKEKINCIDCNAERMITKACLGLVKRCKACQKIFNRDRARNRYRELKGIPIDKPVASIIKKKEKTVTKEPTISAWGKPVEKAEEKPKKVEPAVTPEEQERRKIALQKLFDMLGDDSTDDDW
jgi:hypothetical protein